MHLILNRLWKDSKLYKCLLVYGFLELQKLELHFQQSRPYHKLAWLSFQPTVVSTATKATRPFVVWFYNPVTCLCDDDTVMFQHNAVQTLSEAVTYFRKQFPRKLFFFELFFTFSTFKKEQLFTETIRKNTIVSSLGCRNYSREETTCGNAVFIIFTQLIFRRHF